MDKRRHIGLARALSKLGYCSRSSAFELVRAGRVEMHTRHELLDRRIGLAGIARGPVRSRTSNSVARGRSVPDLNPLNPKLALFVAAWRRLPLMVATRLGPLIVRGIG